MVDKNTCICLKNKKSVNPPIQCTKKRVGGTDFCGIHLRAKKKMLFADYLDNNPNISLTTVKINKSMRPARSLSQKPAYSCFVVSFL